MITPAVGGIMIIIVTCILSREINCQVGVASGWMTWQKHWIIRYVMGVVFNRIFFQIWSACLWA